MSKTQLASACFTARAEATPFLLGFSQHFNNCGCDNIQLLYEQRGGADKLRKRWNRN